MHRNVLVVACDYSAKSVQLGLVVIDKDKPPHMSLSQESGYHHVIALMEVSWLNHGKREYL